jgi:hypothetical protein
MSSMNWPVASTTTMLRFVINASIFSPRPGMALTKNPFLEDRKGHE